MKAFISCLLTFLFFVNYIRGEEIMQRKVATPTDAKIIWSELLPHELAERVKEKPIALIPLGAIEYHGPQCAFRVDISQSELSCWEAVRRNGGVCVDSVCWGGRAGHHLFPGSILVRTSVVRDLLIDIIESTRRAGFKAVLCITGHAAGGQIEAIKQVQEKYKDDPEMIVEFVRLDELPKKYNLIEKYGLERGLWDHGGANETSNIMASAPHRADLSQLPPADADLPFVALEGIDPHLATVEYGQRVLNAVSESIVLEMNELLEKAASIPQPEKKPASLKIVFESPGAKSRYARAEKKNLILLINRGIQKMVPVESGKTEYDIDELWAGDWGVYVWGLHDGPGAGKGGANLYRQTTLKQGENELQF